MLGGVDQLQILRDEFEIDQAAGDVLQVPALAVALLGGDRAAHLDDVAGHVSASRGRHSTSRMTFSTRAAKAGEPERRARG